jgi:hypothetical protein
VEKLFWENGNEHFLEAERELEAVIEKANEQIRKRKRWPNDNGVRYLVDKQDGGKP